MSRVDESWVPPKWSIPVSFIFGVGIGGIVLYASLAQKIGSLESTDAGITIRIDALKSEYDLLHKEVTDARIVQTQSIIKK